VRQLRELVGPHHVVVVLWLLAAVGAGLVSGRGHALLLLGMLCGLWLASRVFAWWGLSGLRVERTVSASVRNGSELTVKLAIRNLSRRPKYFLRITEVCGGRRNDFPIACLRPSETIEVRYALPSCGRGRLAVRSVVARTWFPWLIGGGRRIVGGASEFLIYPKLHDFSSFPVPDQPCGAFAGVGSSNFRGDHDFFGVMPYRRGDNPKHIHWKLSAKKAEIMVKKFRSAATGDVLLFFFRNLEAPAWESSPETLDLFELGVSACGSLAHHLVQQRVPFRFVSLGRDLTVMSGGRPRLQARRILEHLAGVEAAPAPETNVTPREIRTQMRRAASVVMILFAVGESAQRHVRNLRALGIVPTVVLIGGDGRDGFPADVPVVHLRAEADLLRFSGARRSPTGSRRGAPQGWGEAASKRRTSKSAPQTR